MVLRWASSFATLDAAREVGAAVSAYGHIITTIHFLIIDFAVFMSKWYGSRVTEASAKEAEAVIEAALEVTN